MAYIGTFSSCADPEKKAEEVGGGSTSFCNHQHISQRAVRISLEKLLDPRRSIASRGAYIPECLSIPIATCDSPGGWWSRPPAHPNPCSRLNGY